jgi:hypothetical protein
MHVRWTIAVVASSLPVLGVRVKNAVVLREMDDETVKQFLVGFQVVEVCTALQSHLVPC